MTQTPDGKIRGVPAHGPACHATCRAAYQGPPKARSVVASIALEESSVVATVGDDGCGFDEPRAGGSGLGRLAERLTLVGGRLSVESTPGVGTVVRARVPIDALQHPAPA